jgi:hypothetical protein
MRVCWTPGLLTTELQYAGYLYDIIKERPAGCGLNFAAETYFIVLFWSDKYTADLLISLYIVNMGLQK